jgi:tellurite resistance protein
MEDRAVNVIFLGIGLRGKARRKARGPYVRPVGASTALRRFSPCAPPDCSVGQADTSPQENQMSHQTAQEALIHIMVTSSAADSKLKDIELSMIRNFCTTLPVFEGFNIDTLDAISSRTVKLLGDGNGIDAILEIAKNELPERLHETAYALAVEVAAVDVSAGQEELQFLELLGDTLEIDRLGMAAIEHSARMRYRKI